MLSPIVLFVYNRPNHTRTTIEALARNPLARDSCVFIFSDGPKNSDSDELVQQVREYINGPEIRSYFKSVDVFESPKNKGLANSVIQGVSQIIDRYKRVIVVEDDAVPSENFLMFMNKALDFYEDDGKIWTIGGFGYDLVMPKNHPYSVYPLGRSSSYAWGCWKDRWDRIDWKVSDYGQFRFNFFKRYLFNRFGNDRGTMLDAQMNGYIDSWAIRFCYNMFKNKMFSIIPVKTKIRNIGFDGSGTHCGTVTNRVEASWIAPDSSEEEFTFSHFSHCNEDVRLRFAKYFEMTYSSLFLLFIKYCIIKKSNSRRS